MSKVFKLKHSKNIHQDRSNRKYITIYKASKKFYCYKLVTNILKKQSKKASFIAFKASKGNGFN